ncbi:glycosyltransferase [Undibacterium sp. Ji49W]|uniref:glycosyltransferase n=1 Tax=Undibacterium sp. Ji49W TaxID=3413040 RepID=UPI003BEF82B5
MKIGIQTWGSHGDVRPFLALAEGLQAAGHEVSLVITCFDGALYAGFKSARGVKIRVLASPVVSPEEAEKIGRLVYNTRNPMTQMATILRLCYDPVEDAMFDAAQSLCTDADVLIGHYFMHPLQIAAEKAGKPYVSVLLSHAAIPSAFNHPLSVAVFGQTGNRVLWWLTQFALNRTLKHYPNRLRQQLGMPLTQDIVTQVWISPQLALVAVSPQICQAQADWPASAHVCGFLDMPNSEVEGVVPSALASFLAAGDAPVYMTFGSWMPPDVTDQTATLGMFTQAATLAGCRAIIQSPGWQECGLESGDQVLYVSAAPHHAIFPLCKAIVHHGGAGTTQSATLAGKPSVVVAHISEQEHWGNELRRLGIVGKLLKRRKLTARALATKIKAVLNAPQMTVKAQSVAEAMKQENGVAEAVRLINATFAKLY